MNLVVGSRHLQAFFAGGAWLMMPFWAVLFWVWQQPFIHYDQPPLWVLVVGLIVLFVFGRRAPRLLWMWWATGLVTLIWSLTPGNTLVLGMWELLYVAAFVVAAASRQWRQWGFWGLCFLLVLNGMFSAFSLNALGGATYFSGSVHYVLGAQALMLIPVSLAMLGQRHRFTWLMGVVLILSLFAALASGARAVYLPLMVLLPLGVWRMWRESSGLRWTYLLTCVAMVVVSCVALDFLLPGQPVSSVLFSKTALSTQTGALGASGSFTSRLQMWHQTLLIALDYPFGTGSGSFRDTLPALMKYPTVLFASAHNYYLETAATGGWLRLILLLGLLGSSLWRAWRGKNWPIALGVAGLWATFAFDVTGYYPGMMMLAFAGLGMLQADPSEDATALPRPVGKVLYWGLSGAAVGLVAWWFWPCSAAFCAFERHFGQRASVLRAVSEHTDERHVLLEAAVGYNPQSAWVWRAKLAGTTNPSERLWLWQEMARRFPLQSPDVYLEWAKTAQSLGRRQEARDALKLGLARFPDDLIPADGPLLDLARLEKWRADVRALLASLE